MIGIAVALSQVPSDVAQANPADWGNENVFWAGMSVNPVVDLVVSTVQCATSGCDPVSYSMAALPGPSPVTISNATDDLVITNPYPASSRFSRVIPEQVAEQIESGDLSVTLSHPNNLDTFITAAEDLGDNPTSSSVAERLALPASSTTGSNALVTFTYDLTQGSIASPINRTFPEFVGFGRTLGGAREWVIPNLPIRDLPIKDIIVSWFDLETISKPFESI